MFVRIKRRKLRKDNGTTRYAVLVKSVWEQGRPRQKVVRYLARIQECYLTAPAHRQLFWLHVDAHLADLRLDSDTRARCEQRLAREVARPSPEELEALRQQRDVLKHFG